MAEFPAIPFWTDAYLADTAHLTNEEHGVYIRLLMFAWRTADCALPDDDKRLALMVGVTPKKWQSLKPVVMYFWTLADGRWTQKRLTKEKLFVAERAEKARDSANARWKDKPLKSKGRGYAVADANGYASDDANAYAPIPIPTPIRNSVPNGTAKSAVSHPDFEAEDPDAWRAEVAAQEPSQPVDLDPVRELFETGIRILSACGIAPPKARALVGKWRKDYPQQDPAILAAICAFQKSGAVDPVPWITAKLTPKPHVPTIAEIMARI